MTATGTTRTARPMTGDQRLEVILALARQMFYRKGYRAVSIRDLADAVGIKMSSLYYYFPSKEDILYRIIKDHLEGLHRQMEVSLGSLDPDASASEKLRRAIHDSVLCLIEDREAAGVSTMHTRELGGEQRAELFALTSDYERILRSLIEEGMASGEFIETDPAMATYVVVAALARLSTWFRPEGRLTPEQIAAYYSNLLARAVERDR